MKDDAVDLFIGELKATVRHFDPKVGDVFVLTVPAELLPEIAHRLTVIADMVIVADDIKLELVPTAQARR